IDELEHAAACCRQVFDDEHARPFRRIRSTVMDFAASTLLRDAGFEKFDCIAGGETAGIPFDALLADRLGLPMIYVRKQPKG
ncbi:hypothetical protein AB9F45_38390, partial [Rhizobium leguminosarum]